MIFAEHLELRDTHAIFSPSRPHFINYDDDAMIRSYISSFSTQIGTAVHAFAKKKIDGQFPIEDNQSERNWLLMHLLDAGIPRRVIDIERIFLNLIPYVNDAIGYKMQTEIPLVYEKTLFMGTADAIVHRRGTLRIHDLKTGIQPASMDQPLCYAALAFLEYKREIKPDNTKVELRIYQNQEVAVHNPSTDEVKAIMDKITHGNMVINNFIAEG